MGLFDSIFGSDSSSESTLGIDEKKKTIKEVAAVEDKTSKKDISTTGKTTTDTTQETTEAGTADTTAESTVTTLDEGTQKILRDLIGGLSGGVAGGGGIVDTKTLDASAGDIDFADFLKSRAGKTEGVLRGETAAIVAESRRQGENALELQGTRLAAGAGSNLNSIVQAAQAQGRSDLETQLAGLTANLGIQARQAGSQDLGAAAGFGTDAAQGAANIQIGGQSAGVENLSSLIDNLTGATTGTVGATSGVTTGRLSGVTSAVGTSEEETQMTELIQAIQAIAVKTEEERKLNQTTSQSGSETSSPFDSLIDLIGAFPSNP